MRRKERGQGRDQRAEIGRVHCHRGEDIVSQTSFLSDPGEDVGVRAVGDPCEHELSTATYDKVESDIDDLRCGKGQVPGTDVDLEQCSPGRPDVLNVALLASEDAVEVGISTEVMGRQLMKEDRSANAEE